MKSELFKNGFITKYLELPSTAELYLVQKDWRELDQLIANYLNPGGLLYQELIQYHDFTSTEHIIAIRDFKTDEEGIWHDDGSRSMAFTWALNERPLEISGGELNFCKKGERANKTIFKPAKTGTLIIFLTGKYGFEHKVNKVEKGLRKTIAGWCT